MVCSAVNGSLFHRPARRLIVSIGAFVNSAGARLAPVASDIIAQGSRRFIVNTPPGCQHKRTRLIAKDEDAKYVECLDCGEILEAGELKGESQVSANRSPTLDRRSELREETDVLDSRLGSRMRHHHFMCADCGGPMRIGVRVSRPWSCFAAQFPLGKTEGSAGRSSR